MERIQLGRLRQMARRGALDPEQLERLAVAAQLAPTGLSENDWVLLWFAEGLRQFQGGVDEYLASLQHTLESRLSATERDPLRIYLHVVAGTANDRRWAAANPFTPPQLLQDLYPGLSEYLLQNPALPAPLLRELAQDASQPLSGYGPSLAQLVAVHPRLTVAQAKVLLADGAIDIAALLMLAGRRDLAPELEDELRSISDPDLDAALDQTLGGREL